MSNVINSLPQRPLTVSEADYLTENGAFVPLTIKSELVKDIPYNSDSVYDDVVENSEYFVYSLLHATGEKGVSIAFSEKDGCWLKAVEMPDTENYDPEKMEEMTYEFVKQHSKRDVDIDAGFVDLEKAKRK